MESEGVEKSGLGLEERWRRNESLTLDEKKDSYGEEKKKFYKLIFPNSYCK